MQQFFSKLFKSIDDRGFSKGEDQGVEPEFYKLVLKYFLLERTQTGAFQFIRTLTGTEQKFETAVELKPSLNRKN